jgi:adenine-specific DNA glycosylase
VDGNVLRVFARLDNSSADITKPAAKREFTARVLEEMPKERPGPYNEALMELGALVCLPNGAPKCEVCPLAAQCKGRAAGRAEQLPVKTAKPEKTLVPVTAALITGPQGVLLQRRPSKGLLAGLWQPLLWESEHLLQAEVLARLAALGVDTGTAVPEALPAAKHIFSHIEWLLSGVALTVPEQAAPAGCVWASRAELRTTYTLPGAFAAYKDRMLG